MIINNPSKEDKDKFYNLNEVIADETEEEMIISPVKGTTVITIYKLEMVNEELKIADTVYSYDNIVLGDALLFRANRSEGIPTYRIEVKSENGIGEYDLVYNGKDGTPNLEFITI